MFEGNLSRRLSVKEDMHINRMSNQPIDALIDHFILDAASPEQLDGVAFQLLCCARRARTHGSAKVARTYKDGWRLATDMAAKARARLAEMPTRESAPELFNPRSVGRPGCLDSDLFLPFSVRVNLAGLPIEQVVTGCYSAPLQDGAVYDIGRGRFDRIWLTRRSTGHCSDMAIRKLRGLRDLGRLIPVEREAARQAA